MRHMSEKSEGPPAIRLGHRVTIPFNQAIDWLTAYTDATSNQSSSAQQPYAYPAYDTYNVDDNHANRILDADLLAPTLLNVKVSVRRYYGLQRIRRDLEMALTMIDERLELSDEATSNSQISALVKPLYAVLDDNKRRPAGVQVTTLSKVLHRKRPRFLILHDKWIKRCYWGDDPQARVQRDTSRAPSDYAVAISQAIAEDLTSQRRIFAELVDQVPTAAGLSDVRVLDILAWRSQGNQPAEEAQPA